MNPIQQMLINRDLLLLTLILHLLLPPKHHPHLLGLGVLLYLLLILLQPQPHLDELLIVLLLQLLLPPQHILTIYLYLLYILTITLHPVQTQTENQHQDAQGHPDPTTFLLVFCLEKVGLLELWFGLALLSKAVLLVFEEDVGRRVYLNLYFLRGLTKKHIMGVLSFAIAAIFLTLQEGILLPQSLNLFLELVMHVFLPLPIVLGVGLVLFLPKRGGFKFLMVRRVIIQEL